MEQLFRELLKDAHKRGVTEEEREKLCTEVLPAIFRCGGWHSNPEIQKQFEKNAGDK